MSLSETLFFQRKQQKKESEHTKINSMTVNKHIK